MYTQCPECHIAFRVTAKVLQQAGGRVRCGGCDNAFNALDYLSEEMPEVPPPEAPSPASAQDLDETSKRLLKTLDELAGPDEVRIEDTGVEWRVLENAEEAIGAQRLRDSSDTGAIAADDAVDAAQDSLDLDPPDVRREERRYDDNSPLPDEFDDDDDAYLPPPLPQRRASDSAEDRSEFDEVQGDLALSEPGEWTDLLDEVSDADAIPLEVEEELAAIHEQLASRDRAGDAADSEAGTPDESGTPETADDDAETAVDSLADLDTQFELQAEALGITGNHEILVPEKRDGAEELTDEVPLLDESDVDAADDGIDDEVAFDAVDVEEEPDAAAVDDLAADDAASEAFGHATDDPASDITGEIEIDDVALALPHHEDADEYADEVEIPDEIEFEETEVPELIDDVETITSKALDEPLIELLQDDAPPDRHDDDVPSAATDDDAESATVDEEQATDLAGDDASRFFDENAGEVETIIMEGEFVRSAIERERLAGENEARARISEASKLADTYAMNRDKVRGGRRSYDPPSYVVMIGVIVLGVALLAQFVHASRDRFATSETFNQTVGPVYRLLGQPITPQWNVKGWQFESTTGSTDENAAVLTVVSRIANRAEVALPYPLIHVSLTDRWEEVIGSRVLEPAEYLAGDLDPSRPVTPGENFTAVITIENPAETATGFTLYVCYRIEPGQVRCANEDFKD